jgi:hypothetical protein
LQEKLTLLGCCEVFKAVPQLVESILGIKASESQVYRICNAASEALPDADLNSPSETLAILETDPQELIYGMVDGSMLFTDDGWQESKVGRVFKGAPRQPKAKHPSWDITNSEYVAKRGHWKLFAQAFERLLPPKSPCKKVFITDGALWIGLWLLEQYPDALLILDFFHVCEKIAKVAVWADTPDWFEQMKTHLLAGRQLKVRQSILQMKQLPAEQKDDLLTYLENNEYRMKYDEYRSKGLMIGSGPIESAHRTLLQIRMKRSGQRWSDDGCDKMIKLRVALRSQKFDLITNIFRKSAA